MGVLTADTLLPNNKQRGVNWSVKCQHDLEIDALQELKAEGRVLYSLVS